MPAILERLVKQLRAKGYQKSSAFAIATSQLQKHGDLKKGTNKPTAKGLARGKMTPAQRAKDRASKYSKGKHKSSEYSYNPKTNRSKLKCCLLYTSDAADERSSVDLGGRRIIKK